MISMVCAPPEVARAVLCVAGEVRTMFERFFKARRGFNTAEAALIACLLGGACVVVGRKLAEGGDHAATDVEDALATGSPTKYEGKRRDLTWRLPTRAPW